MIISIITTLIANWCELDNKQYSQTSREICAEYLVNCVIDYKGQLIQDEKKLSRCIKYGQRRLFKGSGI